MSTDSPPNFDIYASHPLHDAAKERQIKRRPTKRPVLRPEGCQVVTCPECHKVFDAAWAHVKSSIPFQGRGRVVPQG